MQGYKQRDAFILTKACTEGNVGDFWRMVLEKQCHTIVMLNKCQETTKVCVLFLFLKTVYFLDKLEDMLPPQLSEIQINHCKEDYFYFKNMAQFPCCLQ